MLEGMTRVIFRPNTAQSLRGSVYECSENPLQLHGAWSWIRIILSMEISGKHAAGDPMYRLSKHILPFILVAILISGSGCAILNSNQSDQAALDSLREAGSDLTKPHPFDFYLYHDDQSGARIICAELEKEGFLVTVQAGAIEGEWLCLASLSFVPSARKLSELQEGFEELIATYGGEYDGWETTVIP